MRQHHVVHVLRAHIHVVGFKHQRHSPLGQRIAHHLEPTSILVASTHPRKVGIATRGNISFASAHLYQRPLQVGQARQGVPTHIALLVAHIHIGRQHKRSKGVIRSMHRTIIELLVGHTTRHHNSLTEGKRLSYYVKMLYCHMSSIENSRFLIGAFLRCLHPLAPWR